MQTRVATFAAQVAESGWLAALVVVPVFFNVHTVRIFEEEKAPLLRSLALVIAGALTIWGAEVGRSAWRAADRSVWRLPLVRPMLALTAAYVMSTMFSVAPRVSFWGAYIRAQGLYTWLSYMVVFLAIVLLVRRRDQLERVVTVVVLASVAPSVYGVLQHFALDPIPWAMSVKRVHSTLGNPIFISAYLIMVVPLTMARLIDQLGDVAQRVREGTKGRIAATILLLVYATVLSLQLLTIVYSQSRGPFVGLAVGMAYFFIVFALRRRLRWLTLATTAALAAGAVFLVLVNLPGSPLAKWRNAPYIGRLSRVADITSGTGKVRLLIWEGAANLVQSNSTRALIGYGPETIFLAFTTFYVPELAHYESRGAIPDRAHNETFDALIMVGAVGFVAQLALFVSFFLHSLRWLRLINTSRQRNAFLVLTLTGAAMGTCGPYLVDGGFRWAGIGLPAGVAAGSLLYLVGFALTHMARAPRPTRRDDLLLLALLAAVTAHFIEVHFGIAITATRLLFWVYAGLAVAVGVPLVEGEVVAPADEVIELPSEPVSEPVVTGALVTVSPIVGLLLVILTFDFYRPGIDLAAHAVTLGLLGGSVWVIGALLITAERGQGPDWVFRLLAYATTTLGVWLLFVALFKPIMDWTPLARELNPDTVRAIGWSRTQGISMLYAAVLGIVLVNAAVGLARQSTPSAGLTRGLWRLPLYGMLMVGLCAVAVMTNLRMSWAEVFSKHGTAFERRTEWRAAAAVHEEALRLRPDEDRYATNLGRVYGELAQRDSVERSQWLARALESVQLAQRLSPLNTDHPRNVAKVLRLSARFATDPVERSARITEADALYQSAANLSPQNATLFAEWSTMYLDQQQPERALEVLERAMQIDGRYSTTHWLRAQAHQAMGDFEAAVADYDRALTIKPKLLAAWSGKAAALAQLDRTDAAIDTLQRALQVAPNDLIIHRNLALLYRRRGQVDLALTEARAALAVARQADRSSLETLIADLEAAQATAKGMQ